MEPLQYTPVQPKQTSAAPTYELIKDVSGEPAVKRGPTILKDSKGREFKVPFAPKKNCKRCMGRGFVGIDAKTDQILICRKCYPMM